MTKQASERPPRGSQAALACLPVLQHATVVHLGHQQHGGFATSFPIPIKLLPLLYD